MILFKGLAILGENREEIVKLLSTVGRTGIHAWGDWTSGILEQSEVLSPVVEPGNLNE